MYKQEVTGRYDGCSVFNTCECIRDSISHDAVLTGEAVPLVNGEDSVGRDGDDGGAGQAGLGVSRDVHHRGVRGKLQHHDHVLLHLILKHEWALRKETLMKRKIARKPEMDTDGEEEGKRRWKEK